MVALFPARPIFLSPLAEKAIFSIDGGLNAGLRSCAVVVIELLKAVFLSLFLKLGPLLMPGDNRLDIERAFEASQRPLTKENEVFLQFLHPNPAQA